MGAPAVTNFGPLIKELVARDSAKIPPFPGVALRLQQLVAGGKYAITDLARLVSGDQALAASVLRVANSASMRGMSSITSLNDAISRIGSEELCRIAIAATLGQAAGNDGPLAELRRLVWRRGVTSAFLCKVAAERRKMSGHEAFVCGLLHDFGWVVALGALEDLLPKKHEEAQRTQTEWLSLVESVHVELGTTTAARWKLSPLLTTVMSQHHRPQMATGPARDMIEVVVSADAVCELLEEHPSVTADLIAKIPLFSRPDEAAFVAQILPQIAALVEPLLDLTPSTRATAVPTQVAKPVSLLKGQIKPVTIDGAWVRQGSTTPVQVTALAADGLVLAVSERPRENYVMKVRLETGGQSLDLFATPVRTLPEGAKFTTEARLFGISGEVKGLWDKLYSRGGS